MIKKSFIVLVGGHPKGYDEPFHLKTNLEKNHGRFEYSAGIF